jgi:hypothetical protein
MVQTYVPSSILVPPTLNVKLLPSSTLSAAGVSVKVGVGTGSLIVMLGPIVTPGDIIIAIFISSTICPYK